MAAIGDSKMEYKSSGLSIYDGGIDIWKKKPVYTLV
jgi:hypothetical protein